MNGDPATPYFRVGGTLHPNTPSYVKRLADVQLLEQVLAGQFCYVLTPRQMGKSSLMLRTAERLHRQDIKTAIVDLSSLGTQVTGEQWYLGMINRLVLELKLTTNPEQWWRERNTLPPVQSFTDFLHDVALTEISNRIVIFIDEIDSTLKLTFTDDFFAAIRAVYNRRASQPEYDRLTFVLLGVATPSDLVQDRNRTPFNIGQAIDLKEFSRQDATPLQQGLDRACPGQGGAILDRIFYWTNGHPYLSQKLCNELVEAPINPWPDQEIDKLVDRLFLNKEAQDDNLQFVRRNVEATAERRQLMQLYRRVYRGETVKEDKRAYLQNRLRLIGLVGVRKRALAVRNEIYRQVFNPGWIKENTPVQWTQIVTAAAVSVSILAIVLILLFVRWQEQQKIKTRVETFTERFENFDDAGIRLDALAGLCQLEKHQEAQDIFQDLSQQDQLDILEVEGAGEKLEAVEKCLDTVIERVAD